MLVFTFEQLKNMDTIDEHVKYENFENTIVCDNFWIFGVTKSKVKTWSTSISICLRFFNKNGENIAGINIYPNEKIRFDEFSGQFEVSKQTQIYFQD
jgi:hypothetical protein